MNIDKNISSPNWEHRTEDISIIVIHATAGKNSLGWLCKPSSKVSAHYLIRKDGYIYQLVEELNVAWHAGISSWKGKKSINAYSIGIELENLNDGIDPYPQEQIDACTQLVIDITKRYTIDPSNIVAHYDISPKRKTDPRGYDMDGLRAAVWTSLHPPVVDPPVTYRVASHVATIRTAPDRQHPVALHIFEIPNIRAGVIVKNTELKGKVVTGEPVQNNNKWLWLENGSGFVSLTALEKV